MKVIVLILALLLTCSPAIAGSKKYHSKGRAHAKRESLISYQAYAHWLAAGCPRLIQAPPAGGSKK